MSSNDDTSSFEGLFFNETSIRNNSHQNWTSNGFGKFLSKALIGFELLPTNEVARYGTTIAIQALFHDPVLTSASLSLSTLAIEGGGSIVAADMLDAGIGDSVFNKIRNKLKNSRIKSNLKTNFPIEASIALLAGAPSTVFIKYFQEPERTRRSNRTYGLIMSLGSSAVLGANSLAIAEGISHPSPITISIASTMAGITYGMYQSIKHKLKKKE